MSCWLRTALAVLLLLVATAACGNATPPAENRGASSTSGMPGTPTSSATRGSASPTASPTGMSAAQLTGPVRTADEAAARALWFERLDPWADPDVAVSHVAWMTLGEAWARASHLPQPPPGDPNDVVWWVDFSGAFPIPSCPAPPPGTPSTGCGSSPGAVSILAASDGHMIHGFLGAADRPLDPTAISLQIPSDARLKTPGAAIDAGIQTVPGKDGNPPTLDSLRLTTYRQWLDEQDATRNSQVGSIDANTPVWQVEFSDADFMPPCSIPGGCHIEHVFVAFTPISTLWWSPGPPSPSYPPSTPVPATPTSASATVMHDAPLPDAFAYHNSGGDHVSIVTVTDPPRMTVEQAMSVVAQQVPWGSGGSFEGKPVTVQAWYGTVSVGNPGPNGTWGGPTNIPLPSGEILPNLRGRLVWLLDYGNVPGMVSSTCPGCAPAPVYDHDVYAVDDETGAVLWWASYLSL